MTIHESSGNCTKYIYITAAVKVVRNKLFRRSSAAQGAIYINLCTKNYYTICKNYIVIIHSSIHCVLCGRKNRVIYAALA
jgi:hypothetical protein